MEYKGRLYGKIANKYIDLEVTADDFDRLVEESHQKTIDKLNLIESMAKFQHQKELMIHVLADVHQLIVGWKATTPPQEWTDFDCNTLDKLEILMNAIQDSLPNGAK